VSSERARVNTILCVLSVEGTLATEMNKQGYILADDRGRSEAETLHFYHLPERRYTHTHTMLIHALNLCTKITKSGEESQEAGDSGHF